jgi:hypothetical protein
VPILLLLLLMSQVLLMLLLLVQLEGCCGGRCSLHLGRSCQAAISTHSSSSPKHLLRLQQRR